MTIGSNTAVLDNDFINHIVETDMTADRIVDLFTMLFSELEIDAVVHPLVYTNEVFHTNKLVCRLFDENVIKRPSFEDIFLSSEAREDYYLYLVEELYHTNYGCYFPVSKEQILSYWKKKQSLGEIHSLAMCLLCGCDIFLSDDDDSKKLRNSIQYKIPNTITVYDRKEWLVYYKENGGTYIKRSDRKKLGHVICHR